MNVLNSLICSALVLAVGIVAIGVIYCNSNFSDGSIKPPRVQITVSCEDLYRECKADTGHGT